MKQTLLVLLIVSLTACGRTSTTPSSSHAPVEAASVPAPTPALQPTVIIGDERKPIVAALTKGMELERDKMEGISFYSAKGRNYLASGLEAYISLPDRSLPIFRVRPTYYGDNWVFYDTLKVMADDEIVYERTFKHGEVQHDNSSGSVWETADYVAREPDLVALKKIANAKSATIRFSGRERRDDHELTAKERKRLQEVIATYEQLTTQLQRTS